MIDCVRAEGLTLSAGETNESLSYSLEHCTSSDISVCGQTRLDSSYQILSVLFALSVIVR